MLQAACKFITLNRNLLVGFAVGALVSTASNAADITYTAPEEYLIDTWRFDDDLPRDGIISMAQGIDGYLWVSSRYGVARFDGLRFSNFTAATGARFLGYHYANLAADSHGAVWIATPGLGVLRWDGGRLLPCAPAGNPVFGPATTGLTNALGQPLAVAPDGRVLTWSNGTNRIIADATRWGAPVPPSITQGDQGVIWFVTYQHNLVRVRGTNAEEIIYGEGDTRRNWIMLQRDAQGQLWAATQQDIGRWRQDQFEPLTCPLPSFPVDDLVAFPGSTSAGGDSNSCLWVVALGQAWLRQGERWVTNVPFDPLVGQYETTPRLVDRHGNLWFTTTKAGLVRADTRGGLLVLTPADGLPPGRISSLLEDREGSLWVGIEHAGLARLRERYFTTLGMHDGNRAPLVRAVVEDPAGAIWLGTEINGLQRWQQGRFTQFNLGNANLPGSIYSLCLDHSGHIWAGTSDRGVFQFDNGKFLPVWENPQPGWDKRVYVIYEDRRRRMWFGTGLGLFCLEDGQVTPRAARGFLAGGVRALAEDVGGRLWVGLSGGQTRLAWVDGSDMVPFADGRERTDYDVFGLHADQGDGMWIATVGGGLWHWQGGQLLRYTADNGLPDDRIYGVDYDTSDNLWLSSPAGIFRLDGGQVHELLQRQTSRLNCLVFNRSDGLPTRECAGGSQPSIFHSRDSRLWFALVEGVAVVAPGRVHPNPFPPSVLIEEIRVDGKPTTRARSAGGTDFIALDAGRHVVEFRYTATSLLEASKIRFQCRMDSIDNRWRDGDLSRAATYTLTSPTRYQFQIRACNNDGVWNNIGTSVVLTVRPYLWQTWWFRLGMPATLLLAFGGSIRWLERRKLQRELDRLERQQVIERERARIARDIHDELGASLTEIGLLTEFAQRDSAPPGQVKEDVQKIAAKAEGSIRVLDEIVWAVNPRNDTLESLVTYVCSYAEEQLRLAGVRCRLETDSPVPKHGLRADVRHHLFLALKEALNNIVKHARASQVILSISVTDGQLKLVIADDGCGFAHGLERKPVSPGDGLANMSERLAAIGGTFTCASSPGGGTRIEFGLDLAKTSD